jgi:hypothetical protein
MSARAASRKHEGHKQPLMSPASGGKGTGSRKVSLAHQHSAISAFGRNACCKKILDEVKLTKEQARDAAKKIVQGYVPPIVIIGRMEFSKIVEIVSVEEVADLGTIEPQSQMFIEMNCTERMDRRLSTTLHIDGQSHFDDKPTEWRYVPPEGNPANLLKILCPRQ